MLRQLGQSFGHAGGVLLLKHVEAGDSRHSDVEIPPANRHRRVVAERWSEARKLGKILTINGWGLS